MAQSSKDAAAHSATGQTSLPIAVFIERWRLITGEPPAILLSSQIAMLALLVECTPAAPFEAPIPTWDTGTFDGCTSR